MEPKIINKAEFKVVGLRYYGNNQHNEIPQLWNQFSPRIAEIKHATQPGVSYGVFSPMDETSADKAFEYIAVVEVDSLEDAPKGMVGKVVPAQTYAVFTHRGPIERLGQTYDQIYNTWLPQASRQPAKGLGFELYNEKFRYGAEDSEMYIYIPIEK